MATASNRLGSYRQRRDELFRTHQTSPLTDSQREGFAGLSYFDEEPGLQYTLEIDSSGPGVGEKIQVGTLDGQVKDYTRVGRVTFEVDGAPVTLSVFQDAKGKYFLPFRDGTAGTECYAVGRYLDPKVRPDGRLVIDFNLAYNPYCAYNSGWACPIPPFENITRVPIRAGERLPNLPGYDAG